MILFRQLFDPPSSTYTYVLACGATREAVVIDPVFEQSRRDSALIDELDLTLVATLETPHPRRSRHRRLAPEGEVRRRDRRCRRPAARTARTGCWTTATVSASAPAMSSRGPRPATRLAA